MMQEGLDDGPDFLSEEDRGPRAVNVDLQTDATLQVDISDALSERDKVKFTVHTKSTLPNFKQNEFSVVRQHEEFIWLHDSFVENEDYAGYIIPPAPPRPDFDASREKLQKLGEGEGSMTKEEFTKMKQELEAEYLAIFKKTVAMHEVFLCRVAAHPVLRKDLNFHVFLEYNQDLSVRGKNKKEKLEDFFKNVVKSADGVLVAGVKDVDDFFEHEKTFLLEYHNRVKDASAKSDRMIRSHKNAADDINRIASTLYTLGTQDSTDLCKFFLKVSELFEKTRKIEARVAADEDLKLADLLKYYLRESQAAKDLLYRRSRALVDYENANKALDKARAKNRDVLQAETSQQLCCHKFEKISESAKQELIDFKTRRVAAFRKNLVELAELELKHAKGNLQLLQSCLGVLKGAAGGGVLVTVCVKMSSIGTGYDLSASTFSPDGRVFQVEYAMKAVENSSTAIAIRCKDGVVFGVEKLVLSKLYEEGSNKRIFNIDRHVGMAVAGLLADARSLAEVAREEASNFRSNYGHDIPLKHLSDRVAMYVHAYTLYSAVRPFGCSFILGSYDKDDGPQLYMVDPSGISYGYWGCAIGKAKQAAKTEIEKLQMKEMTCRELVKEVAKIIYIVHDEVKDKAFELELSWVGESKNQSESLSLWLFTEASTSC
ncbi:hypothetical protein Q8A73_017977 [Channa argus]|nr:hypothetical protein Q8A73_017977 [Channa argus]